MASDNQDRITPTVDLAKLARSSAGEREEPTSEVRPALHLHRVPWLMITLDRLQELPIDPRAAFLISLVDGQCSVETIADIAAMPRGEVAETFGMLEELGAIELRDPPR